MTNMKNGSEESIFKYSGKKQITGTTERKRSNVLLPSFTISTINDSFIEAKTTVANKKNLFGDLITLGDLSILFGRSNTGKSFLGYQIAEAIAEGLNVLDVITTTDKTTTAYYNLNNDTVAQKVIYYDFEGTKEKNYMRYSNKSNNMACSFSANLYVSYPDVLSVLDPLLFIDAMELQTNTLEAKVIIIDNLSAISQDNEKSGNAVRLMNKIKDFQRKNNLTVILMAHTPKVIEGQPIISNNLAGSSNLFNLADSVMAINTTSQDTSIRYIKQLKSRYNEIFYSEDNVITIKFNSKIDGFKGYEFIAYESEYELIKVIEKSIKDDENKDIINEVNLMGSSYSEIAKKLQPKYAPGIDIRTYRERIIKRIKALKAKGLINDCDEPAKQINRLETTINKSITEPAIKPVKQIEPITEPAIKHAINKELNEFMNNLDKKELQEKEESYNSLMEKA